MFVSYPKDEREHWVRHKAGGGAGRRFWADLNETNAAADTITTYSGRAELISSIDEAHAREGRAARDKLVTIAAADKAGVWISDGARSMAEWVAGRFDVSKTKASKVVKAAHRLPELPRLFEALATGRLSLDKTIELARFATSGDEARLVRWARRVSYICVKERADESLRTEIKETQVADQSRYLELDRGYDDSVNISGWLPAYEGGVVADALGAIAAELPEPLGKVGDPGAAKLADALVALARSGGRALPSAPKIVVHVPVATLVTGEGPDCRTESGSFLPADIVSRLACDSRLERIDTDGERIVGLGRRGRTPTESLRRAVMVRDGFRCTFPGCEMKRFLDVHHIEPWGEGGMTDMDNLVSACFTHHKLVHTYGWRIELLDGSEVRWLRPDGSHMRAGPAPPDGPASPPPKIDPKLVGRAIGELRHVPFGRIHRGVINNLLRGNFEELVGN